VSKPTETVLADKVMQVLNDENLNHITPYKYTLSSDVTYFEPVEYALYQIEESYGWKTYISQEAMQTRIDKLREKTQSKGIFGFIKRYFAEKALQRIERQKCTKSFKPIRIDYFINIFYN
jgi:hypothetical protein